MYTEGDKQAKQPKCPKPVKQQSFALVTDYGTVSTRDAYAEKLAVQIDRYFFATNTTILTCTGRSC